MGTISEELFSALGELVKAVFSQPVDKTADSKITVRPMLLKGKTVYQAERFRDNRAYHENLDEESFLRFAEREIDGRYRQVLIATTGENVQYVLKNNGTYRKSGKAAVQRPGGAQNHNRSKEYILEEGESIPALVDLGVFTQDFKVVRAKYDKYRQINRFVELIDDEFRKTERDEITILDFGCGKSYLDGHPELWTAETWVNELIALREHLGLERMHLLGQSWGGMLAITYLCDEQPEGVRSVILSSTLSDSQLWGREQHRQISFMDAADQQIIREAEASGDYESAPFLAAVDRFMERHCSGSYGPDAPECLTRPRKSGRESYVTAWGPSEFSPLGTLKDWNYTEKLPKITIPALVISGTNDLSTPLIAKTMADKLPNSRWELFEGCRHMCFAEATDRYLPMLDDWMRQAD